MIVISTILGIDPGTATTGFGVVNTNGQDLTMVTCGAIRTPPDMDFENRLQAIHESVLKLIDTHQPDAVAVEELFFSKNVKTAISVGHARGVILLAASNKSTALHEYNPLQIKKTLTGNGRADKKAVQKLVQQELDLPGIPKPDDAADGLAIAICHILLERFKNQIPD